MGGAARGREYQGRASLSAISKSGCHTKDWASSGREGTEVGTFWEDVGSIECWRGLLAIRKKRETELTDTLEIHGNVCERINDSFLINMKVRWKISGREF